MIPPPSTRWGHTDLALCGALAGVALVLKVCSIFSSHVHTSDPFLQVVMAETIVSASAGAILSALLRLDHRWFVRRI